MLTKEAYVSLGEAEGRAGNGSKIIQSSTSVQVILPPEIYLNYATILCSVRSFF